MLDLLLIRNSQIAKPNSFLSITIGSEFCSQTTSLCLEFSKCRKNRLATQSFQTKYLIVSHRSINKDKCISVTKDQHAFSKGNIDMNGVEKLVLGAVNGLSTISLTNGGIAIQGPVIFFILNATTILTSVNQLFDCLEVATTKSHQQLLSSE